MKYPKKWGKMWNCGEPQNLHNNLNEKILKFQMLNLYSFRKI